MGLDKRACVIEQHVHGVAKRHAVVCVPLLDDMRWGDDDMCCGVDLGDVIVARAQVDVADAGQELLVEVPVLTLAPAHNNVGHVHVQRVGDIDENVQEVWHADQALGDVVRATVMGTGQRQLCEDV